MSIEEEENVNRGVHNTDPLYKKADQLDADANARMGGYYAYEGDDAGRKGYIAIDTRHDGSH